MNKGKRYFTFYDGPPTANGKPHVGHIETRVMKDIIPRYKVMKGYQVIRKAGWDTHGLPVELEIEKKLGISGKEQIEEYGVEKFVKQCKESVFTYVKMWEAVTYKGLEFDAEDKTEFYTKRGERVRSKSEILIANTLNDNNIPYRYECPVEVDIGKKLYPDFMVLNRKQRKEFYWEHLGINLFVTYETSAMPLGTGEIERLISLFL